jgi:TolA-binding protein
MTRVDDPSNHDAGAMALGRVGALLDGTADEAHDLAQRERFLFALAAKPSARRRVVGLSAAALVLSVALGAALFWARPARVEYRVSGPLATEGEWLGVPPDRGAASLRFSEGTEIELGPGTKGRVADLSRDGARVVLGEGVIHARVVHRPRARWSVSAGPYVIEVTGTAFDVGWSVAGERLELSLHDGGVVVKGPSLRDGIRVVAGQRLVAHARTGGTELSSLFAAEASKEATPASTGDRREPTPEPSAPAVPRPPTWTDLVASGNFRTVLDAAEARGIGQSILHGSLGDLVALSDAARYTGDRALARRGLLAQRSRFGSSAEARAAAFVLGRMADDHGSSSEALKWYETYLTEAPKGAFAAEAMGRKLVALVHSSGRKSARETAEAYVKRFPRGAHAAYARELLQEP